MATINSIKDAVRIVRDVVDLQYSEYKKEIDSFGWKQLFVLKEAEYCLQAILQWEMQFLGFDALQRAFDSNVNEVSTRLEQILSEIRDQKAKYTENLNKAKRARADFDMMVAAQPPVFQPAATPSAGAGPQDYLTRITQISDYYSEKMRRQRDWDLRVQGLMSMRCYTLAGAQWRAALDTGYWG